MALPYELEYLYEQYTVRERSIGDIAREWDTYDSKIRRALIKFNIMIRDRGAANVLANKHDRRAGCPKTDETKRKISESLVASWATRDSDGGAERRREISSNILKYDRKKLKTFRALGAEQAMLAKTRGSLIVRFILDGLNKDGRATFKRTPKPVNLVSLDRKYYVIIDGYYRNKKADAALKSEQRNANLLETAYEKIVVVKYRDRYFKVGSSKTLLDKVLSALYNDENRIVCFEHGENIGKE